MVDEIIPRISVGLHNILEPGRLHTGQAWDLVENIEYTDNFT
jgi:hypothetical protein